MRLQETVVVHLKSNTYKGLSLILLNGRSLCVFVVTNHSVRKPKQKHRDRLLIRIIDNLL